MADSLIIHIDGDDSGYRKALENIEKTTKSAMSAMGDSTEKATDAIDDLGEKAEETAEDIKKDFKETEKQSKTSSSKIENNFSKGFDKIEQASEKAKEKVKKIVGKMGAAIVGGLGIGTVSLTALAETTREYREDLNRLDAAFKTSGKSVESARKSYSDFYAVLGEEDRSVEAVNHLAQLCNSQEELAYWSDICAGVSATFGDSLPIEGLTEAANETAKVGKVTGPLADALNWVGIMEDDFNNKLAACNSEQERSAMITKTLNKAYEKQAGTFKSLNANVMNSRKANQKFSDALAEIGEASEPIMTGLREIGAEILKDLTPCLKDVTGYINRNMPSIKAAVMNTLDGAKNLVMFLIDNKDGTVTAITMIGSAFLAWKTVKIVGDTTQSLKNMSFALKTMQGTIEGVSGSSTTLLSVLGGVGSKAALPIATAAAVATAVAAYYKGTAMTTEYIEGLRNVESEIKNICDSYGDNVKAVEDNIKAESGNISTLQILKEELNKIVDANGNVTHGYETRAEYILGELSAATGVEGKLIDGQIKNWNEYSAAVDNAVISLQKELMMESESSKIRTAYESITSLRGEEAKALNEKAAAQREYNQAQAEYLEQIAAEGYASSSVTEKRELAKEALEQAKDAYDEISSQIGQFNSDIKTSEQKIEALANGTPEQIKTMWTEATSATVSGGEDLTNSMTGTAVNLGAEVVSVLQGAANNARNVVGEENQKTLSDWDGFLNDMQQKGCQIPDNIRVGMEDGKYVIEGTYKDFAANVKAWFDTLPQEVNAEEIGAQVTTGLSVGMESKQGQVNSVIGYLVTGAKELFAGGFEVHSPSRYTQRIGVYLVQGLANGITDTTGWIYGKITAWCNDVVTHIKNFFGIHSPSTLMRDEVGKMIAEGIAVGIDDGKSDIEKGMEEINKACAKSEFERKLSLAETAKDIEELEKEHIEGLLDSEKHYMAESRRLEIEKEQSTMTAEERRKKRAENEQKAYIDKLKETAETERKIMELHRKELESIRQKCVDNLKEMAEAAFDDIDELESAVNAMSDKFKSYGSLYYSYDLPEITINGVTQTPTVTKLSDLDKQTETMQKYADNLEAIKSRANVPKEFFKAIGEMSIDEGLTFTNTLLAASDSEFDKYIESWQRKQDEAERIAKAVYADDYEKARKMIEDKFGPEAADRFFQIGGKSAQEFGEGFVEEFRNVLKKIWEKAGEQLAGFAPHLAITVEAENAKAAMTSNVYNSTATYNLLPSPGESTRGQLAEVKAAEWLNRARNRKG